MGLTIVIASPKGGVGKTTLSIGLGSAASRAGEVVEFIDFDPARTLFRWIERREETLGDEVGFSIQEKLPARGKIGVAILEPFKHGVTVVIVDTPPNAMTLAEDVIQHADLVVIPAAPSYFDIEQVATMVRSCKAIEKPFVVVLNRAEENEQTLATYDGVNELFGEVAMDLVAYRSVYATVTSEGLSGDEQDGAAHEEMDALWAHIAERARESQRVCAESRRVYSNKTRKGGKS